MLKLATKLLPRPDAMKTASEAGFGFAELWLDATLLSQWQSIVAMADQSQLRFALHFPNSGELSEKSLTEAVELYHALESTAMVIHAPMLATYGRRLLQLDSNLRLGVENHCLDPIQFHRWATENEWLTLDVEHLWKFTLENNPTEVLVEAVSDFMNRFGDKLVHVHLPGYLPRQPEHRPMYCSRDMVLAVLSLLANHEFDGLVVSEVDLAFQNLSELQMDVLLFERWKELRTQQAVTRVA